MNQRIWTIEEDEYIKNNFGVITFSEMARHIGCAITTVQNRARFLGFEIEKKTVRRWNEEEIELLKIMAPKYLNKTIARKLDRSINELNKKARELGIELIFKRPIWKKWKVKFLRENINILSLSQIQKELEVNYYQIMDKLDELGIEYDNKYWSEEEVNILTELSSKVYIRELAKILNRTEGAIISKASKMGLDYITLKKVYTDGELQYIKDNWGEIPINEIARNLCVSRTMIYTQADKMNLPKLGNNPHRKWTDTELTKLDKLATKKSITELAKYFNTTNYAITTVAHRNGIYLNDYKIHWTEADNASLRELAKTLDLSEIAIKMNKSKSAVRLQAKRQNIKIIPNKKFSGRKRWTEEEYQLLEKLTMIDKKSPKEIAEILGRTEDAVIIKINRRGLQIQTNDKRFWTKEEEDLLSDLWGTKSFETIAKKLNRTVSSIKNKAFILGLGPAIGNNYNGLTIKEISDLLDVDINTVSVSWIGLGLKYKVQKITKSTSYRYVEIRDLYEFLEKNQNIWDSRNLEINILGSEPEWLKEKRRLDEQQNLHMERLNLTKQQLILARKFFLELQEETKKSEKATIDEKGPQLSLKEGEKK